MTESVNKYSNIFQTRDGSFTVVHPDCGEMFHSDAGALLEARSLYIDSSGIRDSFSDPTSKCISVADVGLGLGYNAICTVDAWLSSMGSTSLNICSLEIDAQLVSTFLSAEAPWMINWDSSWTRIIRGFNKVEDNRYELNYKIPSTTRELNWKILLGDALSLDLSMESLGYQFDYIWQDPFSPSKNPGMWSAEWFEKIKKSSSLKVKLMSYSVSGVVKNNLKEAGWQYKKIPTTSQKRNWLLAWL